jgi:hypothetical protein
MTAEQRVHGVVIVYWLIIVVLSAFFLRMSCSLCRVGMPSWKRSFISVFVVTFLTYLVFDFTCYLVTRSLNDVFLVIPPGYSYGLWFREPIGLKWYIVSHAGPLRFVPIVFALCAAGVLQFIVLQADVTFRWGLFIVLLQWGATLLAAYIVSLVFGVALSSVGFTLQPTTAKKAGHAAQSQSRQARTPGTKSKKGDSGKDKKGAESTDATDQSSGPPTLELIEQQVEGVAQQSKEKAVEVGEELKSYAEAHVSKEQMAQAGENLKSYADSHLDELREATEPVTKHLPEPVQKFLNGNGWWWILGVIGFFALLWVRSMLHRLRMAVSSPRKKKKAHKRRSRSAAVNLKEDLTNVGPGYTDPGPNEILVKGLPARLRLVVLSMGTSGGGGLSEEMADRVLDWIKRGLAEVAAYDQPGVRVWPTFYSLDGFAAGMQANLPLPEPKGMKSNWVLMAGTARMGKLLIHVGLALYAEEPNNLRMIKVRGERWLATLAVSKTRQRVGVR